MQIGALSGKVQTTIHPNSHSKEERIDRLKRWGYNPIHIIGDLYLVRYQSKNYTKFSFYVPRIFKEDI